MPMLPLKKRLRLRSTLTAREVLELASYANGKPINMMVLSNMTRPGKLFEFSRTGRGLYDYPKTVGAIQAMLRRRLAAELGRTNLNWLDVSHAYTCPECQGEAVQWNGRWRCEAGHEGELPPESPQP